MHRLAPRSLTLLQASQPVPHQVCVRVPRLAAHPRRETTSSSSSGGSRGVATPGHEQQGRLQPGGQPVCSRRAALPALGLLALFGSSTAAAAAPGSARAAEADSVQAVAEVLRYTSAQQRYSLYRPSSWDQVGKAGADVLFQNPSQKGTTVGVTVYPVRISSLEEFGDLSTVGKRLLTAERAKESTLSVEMLSQRQRQNEGGAGGTIYDFVYRLDSTRGTKQIFSSVTVAAKKLYILNANLSCGKGEESSCNAEVAELLQQVSQSFQVD